MLGDGRIRMHNIISVTIELVICISINHLIGDIMKKEPIATSEGQMDNRRECGKVK